MHDIAAADPYMVRRIRFTEECSSIGRAPVSKTGGCRFESCHSCQLSCGEGSYFQEIVRAIRCRGNVILRARNRTIRARQGAVRAAQATCSVASTDLQSPTAADFPVERPLTGLPKLAARA